ncbi:MAG: hypothetical protein VCF24_16885 [Candidatus Latescibacterota bacterium]
MWLEDVSESTDAQWSIEQYAVAARHLGQMNGGYLELPSQPWLLREFERGAVARDGNESKLRKSLGKAKEHKVLSAKAGESLLGLWIDRERILANLYDRLPQTFGHMDRGGPEIRTVC